ncbi:MAG: HAD hydrolase-like protein [Bacilli bacterium]
MIKKLITTYHASSIYDIDPQQLKDLGYKTIFVDLDNTLAQFNVLIPEKRTFQLIDSYHEIGLEVILISNNKAKRVMPYAEKLHTKYVYSTHKPCARRFKRYVREHSIDLKTSILIGDQLLTDRALAKKAKLDFILTEPLVKLDQWTTKFNRLIDKPLRRKYLKQGRLGPFLTKAKE